MEEEEYSTTNIKLQIPNGKRAFHDKHKIPDPLWKKKNIPRQM